MSKQNLDRVGLSLLAASIAAIAGAGSTYGSAAYAQTEGLEEILVTGTRIRRDDFSAPNPISTFSGDEMRNLGLVNVADMVTQVPSNVSTFQPAATGGSAFFVGSTIANLRGLNPFFGTRTLTLVDSRRHVPTNQGASVDLNFIPSVLIDRVETVTGGASASYGSEAVSGVVNILLDKDLDGVRLEADYSTTAEGDGDNYHFGVAGGTSLFNGRGHIVVGGEFQSQDVIQDCSTARDWCAESRGLFSNGSGGGTFGEHLAPYVPTIPGQPHNIRMSNLRYPAHENGFLYTNVEGAPTYRIDDAGTDIVPFDAGQYAHVSAGGFAEAVGGDGKSIYDNQTLMPDMERNSVFTHFSFDISDRLSTFVELSFGEVKAVNHQDAPSQNTANVCIRPDNAYLLQGSAEMQALFADLIGQGGGQCAGAPAFPGDTNFGTTLVKDFTGGTDQTVTTDTQMYRAVVGFNGDLFSTGNWTWDAYYQYGKTERDQIGSDYRTNHRFAMAVDAVVDNNPASPTFGEVVCRVSVNPFALPFGADPSLAQGCAPLNPFGAGNMSDEARAYAFGALTEFNTIEQHVAAFSFSGELWQGWGAGPLLAAAGADFRAEELSNDAGDLPFAQRTDFGLQYGDSFAGKVDVREAFLELEMPFVSDAPGAQLLMVNAAARRAHYKNTGLENTTRETVTQGVTSWKLSTVWDPTDWLRIRGTRSQDIRAAGFRELYYSQSIPSGGFFGAIDPNPWLPDMGPFTQRDEAVIILSGNARLRPEEAKTTTFGFVVTPGGWAEGLQISVDHYEIKLKDGIVGGNAPQIVQECFDGIVEQCDFVSFGDPDPAHPDNPFSNIVEARAPYINALPYEARGIDVSASYLMQLDGGGSIALRLLGTRALETIVRTTGELRDIAGQTGGDQGFLSDFAPAPDWSSNLIVSYFKGPLSLTAQGRYTSSGTLDLQTPKVGPGDPGYDPGLTNTVDDNTVPSRVTVNLSASYGFELGQLDNLELFGTINNVFDRDPPFAAGPTGGANALFFDTLGRTYRVGVRMQF